MTAPLESSLLSTLIGGLTLSSPLLNASGAFWPETFAQLFPLKTVMGAMVTKTLTAQGQSGNAQQRTVEIPNHGMLNSIGLQGKGLDYFLTHDWEATALHQVPVIVSLSAASGEAFAAMVQRCLQSGRPITALEINLSCPNVKQGGSDYGSSPAWIAEVMAAVKQTAPKTLPVWAKLTPNCTSILPLAEAALASGADGLVAINTVLGTHVDVRRKKLSLSRGFGGYSGPAIKPVALYQCLRLKQAFPQVPVIGVGGIASTEDALEFFMVGCSAIQLGTACFRKPALFQQIHEGLQAYLRQEGCPSLDQIRGVALP
jgi:dihydroorotate dehydrogenase (NAD+) catalytic subunit